MKDISPTVVNELSDRNPESNYNFRNPFEESLPIVKSAFIELETISYYGHKLLEIAPLDIKLVCFPVE